MKKLTRIACLVIALVLSGFATAGAWPNYGYVTCYYFCGEMVPVVTWVGQCCGTAIDCGDPDWSGDAMHWEQGGIFDYCAI